LSVGQLNVVWPLKGSSKTNPAQQVGQAERRIARVSYSKGSGRRRLTLDVRPDYWSRAMVKLARGRLLIAALTLSLLASLWFVVFGLLRNWSWKQEAFVLAVHLGALRADHDFKNGTIRLLELDGEQDRNEFIGRLDGPFEIWNSQYFPSRGYPHQYSTEQMVIMYNTRMQFHHRSLATHFTSPLRP